MAKHLGLGATDEVNAAGEAEVTFTPASEDWIITRTRISCTGSSPPQPTCTTYRSGVSAANQLDSTFSGFAATSYDRIYVGAGETYIARWEDAPVGATATMRIEGIAYPAGQGIAAYAAGGG